MTYRAWDLKTLDRAAVRELTHAIAEQRTEELESVSYTHLTLPTTPYV